MLEYSLPDLGVRRRLCGRQLAGQAGMEEPEGLVCTRDSLYVAWLDSMAVSATPLEALPPTGEGAADAAGPPGAAGAAGPAAEPAWEQSAGARQRMMRRPPGQAQWVMWGMRQGPDGALYVSCNPPYASEAQRYSDPPPEPGRGFVARLALGERGEPLPGRPSCWMLWVVRRRRLRTWQKANLHHHCLPQASCGGTCVASPGAQRSPGPAGCALTTQATCTSPTWGARCGGAGRPVCRALVCRASAHRHVLIPSLTSSPRC